MEVIVVYNILSRVFYDNTEAEIINSSFRLLGFTYKNAEFSDSYFFKLGVYSPDTVPE